MLFWVWVGACVPFMCVMGVAVGVSGVWWCCFQCCVAVVLASRRVPGVVLACSWCVCVVVGLGVKVLWWFLVLMCLASFFLVLSLVLFCLVWLITVWRVVWVGLVRWGYWVVVSCCLCLRAVNGVRSCVCGVACASGCFW